MRSSQVNFFLTAGDQAELLTKLDPLGSFVYIENDADRGSLRIRESAKVKRMGGEALTILVTLPKYLDSIVFEQAGTIEFVDLLRSPVVEFCRCYQDEQRIRCGRFYFIKSYLDRYGIAKKDEEFLKWGSWLVLRTRRALRKDPESFAYFGSEALQLSAGGLKMDIG